uniref:Fruit-specific protein-like n=1 Tax=Nicotiana tabacum TaxID=4097 RepID=A0A1S4AA78_TOBAC|nr:fruit-specific protein-like [Nicotiana tomentosiformis]XP_016473494.1 PREDICTED: fruit-specific protein-like [Nicotiana tabacum]
MAGIKFAFFFAAILLAIVVNPFMISSPKMKVTALRNLSLDMEMVERKLLKDDGWLTCKRPCNQNSDCSDGWFCKTCAIPALGEKYMQCLHHLDSSKYAQVIPTAFIAGGENLLE